MNVNKVNTNKETTSCHTAYHPPGHPGFRHCGAVLPAMMESYYFKEGICGLPPRGWDGGQSRCCLGLMLRQQLNQNKEQCKSLVQGVPVQTHEEREEARVGTLGWKTVLFHSQA